MRPRASNSKSHDARSSASVKPSILGRGAALDGLESQGANADAIGPTTARVDQQSALVKTLQTICLPRSKAGARAGFASNAAERNKRPRKAVYWPVNLMGQRGCQRCQCRKTDNERA